MAEKAIYGLVVCGGKSTRMGREKYLLNYYGHPQYKHVYQLLKGYCENVFISCNREQATTLKEEAFPLITDLQAYTQSGPVAALLSAFNAYPDKDWLVMGCDYPFITATEIEALIHTGKDTTLASAFYNTQSSFYEPLLALYKPASFPLLLKNHQQHQYSLQHFLKLNNAVKCYTPDEYRLQSIDTPASFEIALKQIRESL